MIHRKQTGFTIVELMMAMTFLSMLLLAIALLILQISSIYNKGLTLKAVNETGQLVTSDIQRAINTSDPAAILLVKDATVSPSGGGRLCAGQYVYAWNYGATIASGSTNLNYYPSNSRDVRFIKFKADTVTPAGAVKYCENSGSGYPALPDPSKVNSLIEGGTNNLAVHKFDIATEVGDPASIGQPVSGDPSQRIYRIRIVIGTNEAKIRDASIPANGCQIPDSVSDDEYCAVNEFDFTARAGNQDRSQSL